MCISLKDCLDTKDRLSDQGGYDTNSDTRKGTTLTKRSYTDIRMILHLRQNFIAQGFKEDSRLQNSKFLQGSNSTIQNSRSPNPRLQAFKTQDFTVKIF